ncbi:unnamed protein product [Closterium sp. NIES-65]|nr:unnamed protein product [Closterium sp. NIES-65]
MEAPPSVEITDGQRLETEQLQDESSMDGVQQTGEQQIGEQQTGEERIEEQQMVDQQLGEQQTGEPPGNPKPLHAAANQRQGGVSRHKGSGGAVVNSAFRAASINGVEIRHRSSHERRRRGSRGRTIVTSAHSPQRSSGAGMNNGPGAMATSQASLSHLSGDMRGEFRKAGASDVVLHRRNGGSNRNEQGVNDHEIVGMAAFAQNSSAGGGDYSGGDYSGGEYSGSDYGGGDYNGGSHGGDNNGGNNDDDYNGGVTVTGENGGDYPGGDFSDFVAVDSVVVNGEGCRCVGGDGGNGDSGNGGSGGSIDITGILEEHNKARKEVGVPDLAWDEKIAASAQAWAAFLASLGCPLENNGEEGFGKNLYWLSSAELTPREDRRAVQSWVEEKADWTPSPVPDGCAEGKMCGHYTQVVWRETVKCCSL